MASTRAQAAGAFNHVVFPSPAARHASGHADLGAGAAYWGASTWLPTFLVKERGLDVGTTMARFRRAKYRHVHWLQRLRLHRRSHWQRRPDPVSGLLRPDAAVVHSPAPITCLLWLGQLFAFFMAFAGLVNRICRTVSNPGARHWNGFCFNVGRSCAIACQCAGLDVQRLRHKASIAVCGGVFVAAGAVVLMLPRGESVPPEEAFAAHWAWRPYLFTPKKRSRPMPVVSSILSIYLENDVVSDPRPSSRKFVSYWLTVDQIEPFFPGYQKEDLPDAEAGQRRRSPPINPQRHTPGRAFPLP